MQRRLMRILIAAGAGVRDGQALEVAIAGFAQCRVHTDIRRAAAEKQMTYALRAQHMLEVGIGEGAVAGLVDDDVLVPNIDV